MFRSQSERLANLVHADWEWRLRDQPEFASSIGDHRYDALLDCRSLLSYDKREQHCLSVLQQLSTIDTSELSADERTTWRCLQHQCNTFIDGAEFKPWLLCMNRLEGVHTEFPKALDHMRYRNRADYEAYIARLLAFPQQVSEVVELLREGMRLKLLPPRVALEGVPAQLQLTIGPLEAHGHSETFQAHVKTSELYRPPPPGLGKQLTHDLDTEAVAALIGVGVAFMELKAFVVNTYIPAIERTRGTSSVACSDLPNGQRMYAQCLRFHSGTNLTAADIHRIGLDEVNRIKKAMKEECIKQGMVIKGSNAGEDCDHHEVLAFMQSVKLRPKYISSFPAEHVRKYRDACMRILPNLPKVFSIQAMPRTPFRVAQMPTPVAKEGPVASYVAGAGNATRAGVFYVNTSALGERSFFEGEALAIHQGVPGHHTQTMLAAESNDIPHFRRFVDGRRWYECPGRYPTDGDCTQGWCMYVEGIGQEFGMYQDPGQLLGALNADMFRACRLVVDTGLHSLGWTIAKAVDFMQKHTVKSHINIDVEVRRYCIWPGQATAYKMGEMEMLRLRHKFQEALGEDADVRTFHDLVLLQGRQPLHILEESIDEYMDEYRKGTRIVLDTGRPKIVSDASIGLGIMAGMLLSSAAAAFVAIKVLPVLKQGHWL